MKLRNLMWGACACILATGCSNDDVAVENSNVITNADGESYMAVRIVAANDGMSRATVGNPEFEDGTTTEGNVTSGVFYFYDANGNYAAKGVNNSLSIDPDNKPSDENIENVTDAVIILDNVAATPTEVIAILNGGDSGELDDIFEGLTKTQALTKLSNSYNTGSNFIMSSSTYYDGSKACYTTPISIDNLQPTEALAKQHPVDIYVERLAAKVQLQEKTGGATISDVTNVNINGTAGTLKIAVNGWGLSAINKSGYYIKNLESSWNDTTPWSGWNVNDKHRSYWAKDPNYSSSDNPVYPTDYNDYVSKNITDEEQPNEVIGNSSSLDYLTYNELTQNMTDNNVAYCLENTMDVATLSYNPANTPIVNAAAVTHILIAATMYAESDAGETKQTLYRYKGSFFDETNYKNAALTDLQAVTGDLYKKTNDNPETYTQITGTDIEIDDLGDGKVNIKLVNEEEVWYNKAENTYPEYEGNVINQINGLSSADGFNQGRMYYCVPIEHLNNIPSESSTAVVGSYGVVRNHWYKLTLETISGLGTAVYDPNEEIIPNYDPETYYVAAELNILSWHMVNQSVNL